MHEMIGTDELVSVEFLFTAYTFSIPFYIIHTYHIIYLHQDSYKPNDNSFNDIYIFIFIFIPNNINPFLIYSLRFFSSYWAKMINQCTDSFQV